MPCQITEMAGANDMWLRADIQGQIASLGYSLDQHVHERARRLILVVIPV